MIGVVHMLITSALAGEDAGASLALTPVVVIFQMVGEVHVVPKFVTALLALEHPCSLPQTAKQKGQLMKNNGRKAEARWRERLGRNPGEVPSHGSLNRLQVR